jgi:ribosomal 50S subunit-associated protein YjgA (DUF615 family)
MGMKERAKQAVIDGISHDIKTKLITMLNRHRCDDDTDPIHVILDAIENTSEMVARYLGVLVTLRTKTEGEGAADEFIKDYLSHLAAEIKSASDVSGDMFDSLATAKDAIDKAQSSANSAT